MSSVANPFGMIPRYRSGGAVVNEDMIGTIASGYATNIYQFAPVKIVAGVLQLAASGDSFVGVLLGVEYFDSTGKPSHSNFWPSGLVATQIRAYYTQDQQITYEVQGNASITQANVGDQAAFTTTSVGNATTGNASCALDVSSFISSGASKQLRVVGITPGPDNVFGDAFTNVLVQIATHQFVANVNAI